MGLYKSLFKQTIIYGFATVIPRMFSFILVPIYTGYLPTEEYGKVSVIFAWMLFFNVILSYGMETAFFRFYHHEENDKKSVIGTATVSIFWTSIAFLFLALIIRNTLAEFSNIDVEYVTYTIWILFFDALVIIPFSKLRALQRPILYATIKIGNVIVNFLLNIVFIIYLPEIAKLNPDCFISLFYIQDFHIGYIFISNGISSLFTFLVLSFNYFHIKWHFDFQLWKKMIKYGLPVMIAGIAFAINEHFDKIILENILPKDIAAVQVGIYSACYKLAVFMVLFSTAFRLGIEPFFFSHAKNKNAPQTYAMITKYFVVLGSLLLLGVIVFSDILKILLIRNPSYWKAMDIVPLVILANFFLGIYHNLSVWYKLVDKTNIGAYISIVGAIITLLLNFLLIPFWGYIGSAVATIVAYGSMMFISYFIGNRFYPIPYEIKKIASYLGISVLFSVISFYGFRQNYYVGITLLIVFIYFIHHNEKIVLKSIFGKKKK